jgi:hypothetical protein
VLASTSVDTRKLPLPLLVALGLAPGACKDPSCVLGPCLEVAPVPQKSDGKEDPDVNACLTPEPPPEDSKVEVPACLSPPPDPGRRCLSDVSDPLPKAPAKGGMARVEVLDRLGDVLPADVVQRLRPRSADPA